MRFKEFLVRYNSVIGEHPKRYACMLDMQHTHTRSKHGLMFTQTGDSVHQAPQQSDYGGGTASQGRSLDTTYDDEDSRTKVTSKKMDAMKAEGKADLVAKTSETEQEKMCVGKETSYNHTDRLAIHHLIVIIHNAMAAPSSEMIILILVLVLLKVRLHHAQ